MWLIALAALTALGTILVLVPPKRFAVTSVLAFFFVLPLAEFAPAIVLAQLALIVGWGGDALSTAPRDEVFAAAAALLLSWTLLLRHYFSADAKDTPYSARHLHLWPLAVSAVGVKEQRGVVFDAEHGLKLDVFSPRARVHNAPVLVYIHGGGWVIGHRTLQGRPLMLHLAQRGFVCFSLDYRTSPQAKFPAHVIDCKRGIAWIREHAADYGIDPERIVLAGNSAGGHLAALTALTPDRKDWQPGFEHVRTDVLACVPFYGVYDVRNVRERWPHSGLEWLWRFLIIRESQTNAPQLWRDASPIAHLHDGAPPFFIVHGTHDTMVPLKEAQVFAQALKEKTSVELLVVNGAQHAFELAISPRARYAIAAATRFIERVTALRSESVAPARRSNQA